MDDATKKKLAKILALAEKGVGGEKDNAQRILDRVLKKLGLTIDDICNRTEKVFVCYRPRTKLEKDLLFQCVRYVLDVGSVSYSRYRGDRKIGLELSPVEHAEVEAMFSYYKKLLKEEIETLFMAFLCKHQIGSNEGSGEDFDREEYEKVLKMISSLQDSSYVPNRKCLNA